MAVREIDRETEVMFIDDRSCSRVTVAGNITEIMSLEHKNTCQNIVRFGRDYYCKASDYDADTGEIIGEICSIHHSESRADDKRGLSHSMKRCREIINANSEDVSRLRWMTFTYAENMTDCKRLYRDRQSFWQRVLYWHKKQDFPVPEYISIVEPQGRGAWHMHELWIYPGRAPFLPNAEIANLWGHGFVTVKKLDNCDNVGAYVTAYLCDVPMDEYDGDLAQLSERDFKDAEIHLEDGTLVTKRMVKGARLSYYPPGMNFYRTSRGVKKPTVEWMSRERAKEKVRGASQTFSKGIRFEESHFRNDVLYEYYNSSRPENQE